MNDFSVRISLKFFETTTQWTTWTYM